MTILGDPLRASLKGPSGDVQATSSLTFTAAGSYDPSDPAGTLGPLTWVKQTVFLCRGVREFRLYLALLVPLVHIQLSGATRVGKHMNMLVSTVRACWMIGVSCRTWGQCISDTQTHTHLTSQVLFLLLPRVDHPRTLLR